MKSSNHIERLNLYLERDLFKIIKQEAQAEYLPVATWVKQFLQKNLHKNNMMSNLQQNEN